MAKTFENSYNKYSSFNHGLSTRIWAMKKNDRTHLWMYLWETSWTCTSKQHPVSVWTPNQLSRNSCQGSQCFLHPDAVGQISHTTQQEAWKCLHDTTENKKQIYNFLKHSASIIFPAKSILNFSESQFHKSYIEQNSSIYKIYIK